MYVAVVAIITHQVNYYTTRQIVALTRCFSAGRHARTYRHHLTQIPYNGRCRGNQPQPLRQRNLKEKTLFKMVHIPGIKNRAPDSLSQHPTGDHNPPKMVLHDDVHSIQEGTTVPPLHIPTQLIAGICTDDQPYSTHIDTQLRESLICSLESQHTGKYKPPHHLMQTWSPSSLPLKTASLN